MVHMLHISPAPLLHVANAELLPQPHVRTVTLLKPLKY